jgi:four helix bundle protein
MNSKEARSLPVPMLSLKIWKAISKLPPSEKYAGDWFEQTTSAALSVGSNWCEAIGRKGLTRKGSQSLHTLNIFRVARGSGYELSFQVSAVGLTQILKDVDKMCDIIDREIDEFVRSISLDTSSP